VFAGPLLTVAVLLTLALGVSTERAWASSVVTPVLLLVLASGILSFVLTLTRGGLEIPVGVALAIWALAAPPARGAGRLPVTGVVLLAAAVVAAAWPFVSSVALQPGGPLIVAPSDLQTSVTLTGACVQPGGAPPAEAPETVDVTVAWSWTRSDFLMMGTDTVTIAWYTARGDGLSGYGLDSVHPLGAGISESNRSLGGTPGIVFAVDIAERGFEPGQVTITLRRPNAVPVHHGSIEITAHYAHGPNDIYGQDPSAFWTARDPARCEW
jgi:hypothetical protein